MDRPAHVRLSYCCLLVAVLSGCSAVYQGIKVGLLSTLQHGVSGDLYAMNDNTLKLVNFNYDGRGPAGRFYIGLTSASPDTQGRTISDEKGSDNILGKYIGRTIILSLPNDVSVRNIKWFSVWCTSFKQDFGSVIFPAGFTGPERKFINQISQLAHGVGSGNVYVEDTKTFTINNLNYDGRGPDAFFILGTNAVGSAGYVKIPDENNNTGILKAYGNKQVRLSLPAGVSIHGFTYLSLYCVSFTQDFGHVTIPADLEVPFHPVTIAEMAQDGSSNLDNCEQLDEDFNVAWSVNTSHITLEFVSVLDSGQYMSFGLSGSDTASVMKGGDIIVARYSDDGVPLAVDYYLEDYAQCSVGKGACPDEQSGGKQDIRVIEGSKVNGVARVKVIRKLNTGDTTADNVYTPDMEQYIIWARGGLNEETYVTKHGPSQRLSSNKKIQFGRTPSVSSCGTIQAQTTPYNGADWTEQKLYGRDTHTFNVKMGPTGGDKGYKAITEQQSWGIAYYVNGLLIPQIELRRGGNYVFRVEGGYNKNNTAKYHPLYITTDPRGGYKAQSTAERARYTVYVGIDKATNTPASNAVGKYCEYVSSGGITAAENSATFTDFKSTLSQRCDPGPEAGVLVFSPDANTPEWLYYQCYTHFRLGWKIHIVDEYTISSGSSVLYAFTPASITTLLLSVSAFVYQTRL